MDDREARQWTTDNNRTLSDSGDLTKTICWTVAIEADKKCFDILVEKVKMMSESIIKAS